MRVSGTGSAPSNGRGEGVVRAGRPHTRRWAEQRWLVDNVIQANGIDWDQPRSVYLNAPCGPEANADFATLRAQVKKYADAASAFETAAKRRQAKAEAAEAEGRLVTARENYFIAAVLWGGAQWPIDEADETNHRYNKAKRDCYRAYARLADHRIEEVFVPFGDKVLPAWFHLPPGYTGGKLPTVISIPGMDSFKEGIVSMYGDRFLSRGMAVLALDGPGQYEAPLMDVFFSMENWIATGPAAVDWLAARPEVDVDRIALAGRSFGSFFGTIMTAHEPRIRACAVSATCHEPGCETIFQEASPTFKQRFMFMCGMSDEAEFDAFRQSITWKGHADRITVPYLCMAGEFDELSPIEHTRGLLAALRGPKQLLVYQGSRHSVGGPAAANGPHPQGYMADWLQARLEGKPLESEEWFVESSGKVVKSPL